MGLQRYFATVHLPTKVLLRKIHRIITCCKSRLVHHQYDIFLSTFSLSSQSVTYDQFKENFKNIVENIQTLGKKHPLKKRYVMDTFSLGNWLGLKDRQLKHTIFDCKGCLENEKWKDALAMLPVRGFLHQAKAKNAGLIEKQVLHTTFTKQVKRVLEIPKPRDIEKSIKTDIENQWEESCDERYVKLFQILLQSHIGNVMSIPWFNSLMSN